ncbi:MAG: hypothetical protein Q9162_006127 [Coniocarpon cinnabarinum]
MAEKRPHPSTGYSDAETKRPKPSLPPEVQARLDAAKAKIGTKNGPPAAKSTTTDVAPAVNGQKIDLASIKARIAATRSPGPSQEQQNNSNVTSLDALKARIKKTQNLTQGKSTQVRDDIQPPENPLATPQGVLPTSAHTNNAVKNRAEDAHGGLNTALHPMLMEGFRSDNDRGKSKGLPGARHPTTAGNRRPQSEQPVDQLELGTPSIDDMKKDNPYFDTSLTSHATVPHERRGRSLNFNLKGKYIEQANELRKQAQLADAKARIAAEMRRQALLEDKSEQNFLVKDVPALEWWDEALVHGEAYPDFENDPNGAETKLKIDLPESAITNLIQHPVLLDPPFESLPTQSKPMYLTKKEQKKMRLQNRMADLKEKQAKVRLGLQEPDPPKIKKSNLMRVLGNEAVKDPTAVEARVTREIEERAEKHDAMNEERALSKGERKQKNEEKAQADASRGLFQSVYRVDSLAYGKNRSKIDMNAKQYRDLTGIVITNPNCCCVVIEAGQHTQKAMKKLMLNRIKWTENASSTAPTTDLRGNEKAPLPQWLRAEDARGWLKDLTTNKCSLVWEGEVKQRNFKFWAQRDCETDGAARQTLERNRLENAWVMARNWNLEAF